MRPLVLSLALHAAGVEEAVPPSPVDITWRGEDCPVDRFHASLAAYLTGTREPRPLRVVCAVRRAAARRWTADLELTSDSGHSRRRLHGASCSAVAEAAAFVTAVAVDPGVLSRDPGAVAEPAAALPADAPPPAIVPEPQPPPDTPPVVVPPPTVTPPTAHAPARRAGPRGFVRVTGGLEAFGLPRVGPQVGLAAGLLGRAWRFELAGSYRAPTTEFSDVVPTAGARLRLWAVAVRGCGVVRPAILEVPLCAGIEAGQVIGEGVGYDGGRTARLPWAAAVFGPALAWAPRRWFAVSLGVDLGIPLVGGTFDSEGLGQLYKILPVSLRAALGLEARFF